MHQNLNPIPHKSSRLMPAQDQVQWQGSLNQIMEVLLVHPTCHDVLSKLHVLMVNYIAGGTIIMWI